MLCYYVITKRFVSFRLIAPEMGIKRDAVPNTASKSADKRARYEAGLDLLPGGAGHADLDDTAVEHIVREVKAPKSVQEKLNIWTEDLCKFLTNCSFPKVSPSSLPHPPSPLPPAAKYPGAALLSCAPVGQMKNMSLVFPAATGQLVASLQFAKLPATAEKLQIYLTSCLAQLVSQLSSCPLLDNASLHYQLSLFSSWPSITFRPAGKLGKHLTIELVLVVPKLVLPTADGDKLLCDSLVADQLFSSGLQAELDSLTSQATYQTAATALDIWARQATLALPSNLLATILLHCHTTTLITDTMKPWQMVKKVWATLASMPLSAQQLILGVLDPVPASGTSSCPVLGRDGTSPLFPALTPAQWGVLVQAAARASGCGVEGSLLKSLKAELVFDRIFEVKGEVDVVALVSSLGQGLGGRVAALAVVGGNRCWQVEEERNLSVEVGVRFDPTTYWQPATQGPEASCKEAQEFRKFWGDRSELRRFQDGVVKEVVVWSGEKVDVVGSVVRAVVGRHHKGCQVEERGDWGEQLLSGDGGGEAKAVLDKLVPVLYGLEKLPLKVAAVAAIGGQARRSKVGQDIIKEVGGKTVKDEQGVAKLTGKLGMAAQLVEPLDVMLVAEHSGKWPKDGQAVRRMRLAWLGEVGKQLEKQLEKKTEKAMVKVMGERLVVMMSGQILRFCVGDRGEGEVGQQCELASWLGGMDRTWPAWSGCVRLVQRWAASHLLSTIPTIAMEVSVATVLSCASFTPTSPTAAFLLWLHTMSTHDWNLSPLTYPGCATTMTRTSLPPMAVLCPHSPSPSYWTKSVTWPELQRLVTLATTSLSSTPSPLIFKPSLFCYEALIHLKPLQVPTRNLAISSMMEAREMSNTTNEVSTLPILSHNPVSIFVSTLQSCYGNLANFYFDKFGGTVVAVKLLSKEEGKEKVKLGDLTCKMVSEGKVTTNWGAVIEDWSILGEGLVKEVEVLNTDLLL